MNGLYIKYKKIIIYLKFNLIKKYKIKSNYIQEFLTFNLNIFDDTPLHPKIYDLFHQLILLPLNSL